MSAWGPRVMFFVLGASVGYIGRGSFFAQSSISTVLTRATEVPHNTIGTSAATPTPDMDGPTSTTPAPLPAPWNGTEAPSAGVDAFSSVVSEVVPFYHRLENICLRGGTGDPFLLLPAGEKSRPDMQFTFRADSNELTPYKIPWLTREQAGVSATTALHRNGVLWTNLHFGKMGHSGHWVLFCAFPYMVAQLAYLSEAERARITLNIIDLRDPTEYVFNLTEVVTDTGRPIERVRPAQVECWERGFFGLPSWEVESQKGTVSELFDGAGGREAFFRLRERFWAYVERRVPAALPQEAGGQAARLQVFVTIRTPSRTGFARNITNTASLLEDLAQDTALASRADVRVVSWSKYPLTEQLAMARTCDVMMGVHGNNLVWQMLMRPQSAVVEMYTAGQRLDLKGTNIGAASQFRSDFMPYIGLRLNHTVLVWVSSNLTNCPLASKAEYAGKVFSHRCKKKSSRQWMCRNLFLSYRVFSHLLTYALDSVGNFTGVPILGRFAWEEEDIKQHGHMID